MSLGGCTAPLVSSNGGGQTVAQMTTDVVKRQDLTGYSFFDGKLVIPDAAQATAYSPYDTPVLSVMTGEGKHVGRGEPIIKLIIPGADAAAAAAKADVSSAQANYSAQKGGESEPVRDAKRMLDEARAIEKSARETIANGGQADLEGATIARQNAEAELTKAQSELRQTLEPTRQAVNQAASNLVDARADAAKGIVRAPISGTVVTFAAQAGMSATAKQPLATIINFDAVRVQGFVPAELKDLVLKDTRVIIAMNGVNSAPLDGSVIEIKIAPPSEGQQGSGYLAVIGLLKPSAMAQHGLSVKRIGVKAGTVKDVLVVPVGAIFMKEGKAMVSIKSGDHWVDTLVETGMSDGALTEIKSGLTEGAVVRVQTQMPANKP